MGSRHLPPRASRAAVAPFVALVALASLALSGCAGGGAQAGDAADKAPTAVARPELQAGKGAIAGLLVDDRYRPLHLTDKPAGEFDAAGFILLVETGAQLVSDADGQFTAVDLEPGTYTLKPAVQGHEGAPIKVDVAAGQYAEVDLLVRRLVTPAKDTVIVHDDTVLITCQAQTLDAHFTVGVLCHGDLGEAQNANWIDYNFTGFPAPQAIVVEVQFSRVGDYELWLTQQTNLVQSENLYAKELSYDADHFRYQILNGSEEGRFSGAALDTRDLRIWVNVDYTGTQEADQATGIPMSAGFTFVVEARLVVSAFLEVPADLDSYSLLGT